MSYDTRGVTRQPGTQEGARRVKLTDADLEALGLQFEPGVNCPSCASPLDQHSDADCLVVLMNALKSAGRRMVEAQERAEELEEMAELLSRWMAAKAPERSEHYTKLFALVREYEEGVDKK